MTASLRRALPGLVCAAVLTCLIPHDANAQSAILAVRPQLDGSVKHLPSGFVCPAGVEVRVTASSFDCGLIRVLASEPGSADDAIEGVFAELASNAYAGDAAMVRLITPSDALPTNTRLGGQIVAATAVVTERGDADYRSRDLMWRFDTRPWTVFVMAGAAGSDAEIDAAMADASTKAAVAWQSFASINALPLAPEPVSVSTTALGIIQNTTRRLQDQFKPAEDGVRMTESGFVCPIYLTADTTKPARLSQISRGDVNLLCMYASSYGTTIIAVGRADVFDESKALACRQFVADQSVGAVRLNAPAALNGHTAPLKVRSCATSDLMTQVILATAVVDGWRIGISAIVPSIDGLDPARLAAAKPYLDRLIDFDTARAEVHAKALWDAASAINAKAS